VAGSSWPRFCYRMFPGSMVGRRNIGLYQHRQVFGLSHFILRHVELRNEQMYMYCKTSCVASIWDTLNWGTNQCFSSDIYALQHFMVANRHPATVRSRTCHAGSCKSPCKDVVTKINSYYIYCWIFFLRDIYLSDPVSRYD
jgi:hypothetical protein